MSYKVCSYILLYGVIKALLKHLVGGMGVREMVSWTRCYRKKSFIDYERTIDTMNSYAVLAKDRLN